MISELNTLHAELGLRHTKHYRHRHKPRLVVVGISTPQETSPSVQKLDNSRSHKTEIVLS